MCRICSLVILGITPEPNIIIIVAISPHYICKNTGHGVFHRLTPIEETLVPKPFKIAVGVQPSPRTRIPTDVIPVLVRVISPSYLGFEMLKVLVLNPAPIPCIGYISLA